jgi:hypothetical protein
MKRLLVILVAVGGLAACGVDRDGTRDNIVDSFKDNGQNVDSDCVDNVLDGYSDDELTSIDEELDDSEPSPQSLELLDKIFACATPTT